VRLGLDLTDVFKSPCRLYDKNTSSGSSGSGSGSDSSISNDM
jgi:hypothetical protein